MMLGVANRLMKKTGGFADKPLAVGSRCHAGKCPVWDLLPKG